MKGRWAGRDLTSPGGSVRPTAEAVRDAWLDLLADDLEDARVVDLFAGSGAVGLEALSRGAKSVDLIENGASALHALKANVAALRVGRRARIFKRDAIPFVERLDAGAYDIALADPPYRSAKLDRILEAWQAVPFARILAFEHDKDHVISVRGKQYDFGGPTRITVLRSPDASN